MRQRRVDQLSRTIATGTNLLPKASELTKSKTQDTTLSYEKQEMYVQLFRDLKELFQNNDNKVNEVIS